MVNFTSEAEMFDTMRDKLYASVISDVVDSLGARNQQMRADIRPVWEGAMVVGRAYPVLTADIYKLVDDPYGPEIDAVDSLKPNDVMVVCTQRSTRTCFWGELLSTAARVRGARGIVIDGYTRDVAQITKMKFPTFATGIYMVDSAGRSIVVDHNCPVDCGGVLVNPGDIIFGDIDGVVVIPRELEKEVIPLALEKVSKENQLRDELLKGSLLRDAYNKYGIL
ncbi:MAG: RraA family protein [Dehalococcoidia bacterium]|nr:RraA family protein [Dehalococcoidia bacterium]MBL7125796.1 RraA family protein [Dehalococcoidales bacterium]